MLPRRLGQEAAAVLGDAVDRRDEALVERDVQADHLAGAFGAAKSLNIVIVLRSAALPRERGNPVGSLVECGG